MAQWGYCLQEHRQKEEICELAEEWDRTAEKLNKDNNELKRKRFICPKYS